MGGGNNYPAGVGIDHRYFDPWDTCQNCGEDAEAGTDCTFCGEYVMTDDEARDAAADDAADRMRDEAMEAGR